MSEGYYERVNPHLLAALNGVENEKFLRLDAPQVNSEQLSNKMLRFTGPELKSQKKRIQRLAKCSTSRSMQISRPTP